MTQRIFDTYNEKDMADLWNIVPENIVKIRKAYKSEEGYFINFYDTNYTEGFYETAFLIINWREKTEIHRPIKEATYMDIGKLCYFWANNENNYAYGILTVIDNESEEYHFVVNDEIGFPHCRRLTVNEVKELC